MRLEHNRANSRLKKQKWTPKETSDTINTFIELAENDKTNVKTRKTKSPKPNLAKEEKTAMEELAETTVIMTNADKDGAIVIKNTDDYINEANHQLSDKDNYKQLPNGPTLQHNEMGNNTIERFQKENLWSKKPAEGLKIFNPKTPKFWTAPKIHKENNPGRIVINSITCHTSEISRFADHYRQPVVKEIPYYNIDKKDFFQKINNLIIQK